MDNPRNIAVVKVEDDGNEYNKDEVYEEYVVTFSNCKKEEHREGNVVVQQQSKEASTGGTCNNAELLPVVTFSNCKQEHRENNVATQQQANGSPTEGAFNNAGNVTAENSNGPQTVNGTQTSHPKLNLYTRNLLVKHFIEKGCSAKSYDEAIKKTSKEKVQAYEGTINRMLKESQEYVYQECESLCFSNISEWLEVFKARKVPENCHYEPSIVLNAIANTEEHPDPKTLGGVDLKSIYSFLSNGLMGLPQKPMDPVSAKFLAMEFENLINDANSDFADAQTMAMKEKLERLLPQKEGLLPPSLDPLWLLEGTILHKDVLKK